MGVLSLNDLAVDGTFNTTNQTNGLSSGSGSLVASQKGFNISVFHLFHIDESFLYFFKNLGPSLPYC